MKLVSPQLMATYKKLILAQPKELKKIYLNLEKDTIDYALIEKVNNLLVVAAAFGWADLGTFEDIYKVVDLDESGNYFQGSKIETEEVENSFIQNFDNKPMAVIGLDNIIIVNTKDGLLVARKDRSQEVGDISKRFYKN
jgi:mannose-1-phosphate guanylyltransferase